jgi:hypothetical protein
MLFLMGIDIHIQVVWRMLDEYIQYTRLWNIFSFLFHPILSQQKLKATRGPCSHCQLQCGHQSMCNWDICEAFINKDMPQTDPDCLGPH